MTADALAKLPPRPLYTGAGCGLAVIVLGEQKIRACRCDAAIIAHASVDMAGRGGVKA